MERRAGLGCYVSWIALAVAFSPVLVDLARSWVAEPTDRVVLIAPLLLLLALRRGTANGIERRTFERRANVHSSVPPPRRAAETAGKAKL